MRTLIKPQYKDCALTKGRKARRTTPLYGCCSLHIFRTVRPRYNQKQKQYNKKTPNGCLLASYPGRYELSGHDCGPLLLLLHTGGDYMPSASLITEAACSNGRFHC